jgi:hypothetical protein
VTRKESQTSPNAMRCEDYTILYHKLGSWEEQLLWLADRGFDIHSPLIIFDDSFRCHGIDYACSQRRAFCVIQDFDLTLMQLSLSSFESLTFFGERYHFTFEFLRMVTSIGVPVSIMTANDESALLLLLSNSRRSLIFESSQPLIANLFGSSGETGRFGNVGDAVTHADLAILGVHGDVLCAFLGDAILCSRQRNSIKTSHQTPECAAGGACFRKCRLGREDEVRLVRIGELEAKALVLNTCAGFAITGTKFGDYSDLLPMKAIEHNVIAYVSSYLIKDSCAEEIYLFWVLLKKHRTFSRATFYFNEVRFQLLGSERSFLTLGDGRAGLNTYNDGKCTWQISYADADSLILDVSGDVGGAACLELRKADFALFVHQSLPELVAFVDTTAPVTIAMYPGPELAEAELVHIAVQFQSEYPASFHLCMLPRRAITGLLEETVERSQALDIADLLRFEATSATDLKASFALVEESVEILTASTEQSELNGRKYLFMLLAAQAASKKVDEFEELLSRSILKTALATDTHLTLNEASINEAICRRPDVACYICGNALTEQVFRMRRRGRREVMQTVCPRCEIISLRMAPLNMLHIHAPTEVKRGSSIRVQVQYSRAERVKLVGCAGIALLNGGLGVVERCGVSEDGRVLNATFYIQTTLNAGLYYLRAWFLTRGSVTISHKQIYLH